MFTGGSTQAVKQLVHKANHSLPLSAKVKEEKSNKSTLHLSLHSVCGGSALPLYWRGELNQEWESFVFVRTVWQEEWLHSACEFRNEEVVTWWQEDHT